MINWANATVVHQCTTIRSYESKVVVTAHYIYLHFECPEQFSWIFITIHKIYQWTEYTHASKHLPLSKIDALQFSHCKIIDYFFYLFCHRFKLNVKYEMICSDDDFNFMVVCEIRIKFDNTVNASMEI